MEKIIGTHNVAGTNQHTKKEVRYTMLTEPTFNENVCRTRERLGEEYRISEVTVYKYGIYAQALDKLSKAMPKLFPMILSGELKLSHENLVEMSHLSRHDIRHLSQLLSDDTSSFFEYLRKALLKSQQISGKHLLKIPSGSVKNMPVHDPDAEISSLAFTIPSWVRSIEHARSVTNLNEITDNARQKIVKELTGLMDVINSMLAATKEEN